MRLRTLWITALALSVLAAVALGVALESAADEQRAVIAIDKQRQDALRVVARLRREAEDLTRMARGFAVTGDARYQELYRRMVEVHEGKAPQPPGDPAAYWDLLLAGAPAPKGEGERLALVEELSRLKLPSAEQAIAKRALAAQEALLRLEAGAIGQPDPVQALKILYGDEYLAANAQFAPAAAELYTEAELRTRGALAFAQQSLARGLQTAWLILGAFVIAALALLGYVMLRAVLPMHGLKRQGASLLQGDYSRRTETRALPEIVELTRTLNEAASRIESGTRELAERERYLEALLRTSPLGLALVDGKYRVRWTSRRLREFLGDAKQDLKQMPFEELFAEASELSAFREAMDRKGRVRELLARIRRRDGSEFRARLDSSYVEVSAERMAAVWIQAFGLHGHAAGAAPAEESA